MFLKKFRNNSLKNYGLCPSHYLSAPGLGWDATLKMKKIEPELITYPHMCIFFTNGSRGGISCISNKYSKDNNKYLISYGPKQECVLEFDLEYPKELQELQNDYPLIPNKREIKREMLSDYELKISDLYNISIGNVKKLVLNLFDKEKYVIHL